MNDIDQNHQGQTQRILEGAVQVVRLLESDFSLQAADLEILRDRLAMERFHLAVLGQFKRGKSTLLNAMLGESILPTSVLPLTSVPTLIRHREQIGAAAVAVDGRTLAEVNLASGAAIEPFLEQYGTESGNPGNKLGVARVELFHPAEILRDGVVLVDTPGIGSTNRRNTDATLAFLPQCDAALFVISSDPPITEVEIEFLEAVKSHVARLFIVLNKVDYLSEAERELSVDFLRQAIRSRGIDSDVPVFCVSARQGLEARQRGDTDGWVRSGMDEVERRLVGFLAVEKSATLRQAVAQKASSIVRDVLSQIGLTIRALQMPVGGLEQRLVILGQKAQEAERERIVISDLVAADGRRAITFLYAKAEELRQKATAMLQELVVRLAEKTELTTAARQDALAVAIEGIFSQEMPTFTAMIATHVADTLQPHRRRVADLVEGIRQVAAEAFDLPYFPLEEIEELTPPVEPAWSSHEWEQSFGPVTVGMIDAILPTALRQKRLRKRLTGQMQSLVVRNVGKLRLKLQESIEDKFRQFSKRVNQRISQTLIATRGAANKSLEMRNRQQESVSEEVRRLERIATNLTEVVDLLAVQVGHR